MTRVRIVAAASLALAAAALALGYGQDGRWAWSLAVLVATAVWVAGQWRRWPRIPDVGLPILTGFAAVGVLLGLRAELMVLGLTGALCAWDLDRFLSRLEQAGQVRDPRALADRHLGRLLSVAGLGLLLALLALQMELRLTLWTALLLGLLAVLALGRTVRYLRRQSD
ncbi:MAG: hypothetical protein ACK2UC_07720 [Anaerolineae bacterium]|jgi:hypothetical protein